MKTGNQKTNQNQHSIINITTPFTSPAQDLKASQKWAHKTDPEKRGAIYTKREVVEFILDLVDYTTSKPLTSYRILEPSFGAGDFLDPILERLLSVAQKTPQGLTVETLAPTLRAVELHKETFEKHRAKIIPQLRDYGLPVIEAEKLASTWLIQDDFLLHDLTSDFTHVVGNPPYIRQEAIPDTLMKEYRLRYKTISGRADIYIPFMEKSLNALAPQGKLSFICSDRWMKNHYGKKLRQMISEDFSLPIYVDMVNTPAFHTEVTAYPAITVLKRSTKEKKTRVFKRPHIQKEALSTLSYNLKAKTLKKHHIQEIPNVTLGEEPWILSSPTELKVMRYIEAKFPKIEAVGCKVGIGVATGADQAFIAPFTSLNVEPSRKLPLVMSQDLVSGEVKWQGQGVINPWAESGKLVQLEEYPHLACYLEKHKAVIANRYVAQKNPAKWYRTLDLIHPQIMTQEKLLIPDIKGSCHIVYEPGQLYPHHNLYFITSNSWDIRALQTVLRSGITRLFISLYSTKMRGEFLRFQAQYLRRICLPPWKDVSEELKIKLRDLATTHNLRAQNKAVAKLYGLSPSDMRLVREGKRKLSLLKSL